MVVMEPYPYTIYALSIHYPCLIYAFDWALVTARLISKACDFSHRLPGCQCVGRTHGW